MNNLYLIFKNLTRNKLRLFLNSVAILIAFLLFGFLGSLKNAFESGVELSADDRLMVVNKINFTQPLPISYVNKIKAIEGVKDVSHANWFGGYYQEPRNQAMTFAVDAESYLRVYGDIVLDENAKNAWLTNQQGIIVGERMASVHSWSVGDRIPLSSNIFSQDNGSNTWDMTISGIFKPANPQTDTNFILMHYKYFNETQKWGGNSIGWLPITTDDPSLNQTVADAIDKQFANSSAETETSTESQFNKAFLEQLGDISLIITGVVAAGFFTILLVVGTSMAQNVSERTAEIAVLKTLGFSAKRVFGLILTESLLLALIGGLIGLFLAGFMVTGASQDPQLKNMLPNLIMSRDIVVQSVIYMLMLGFITGFIPAWRAMKLNIIDALNRN